MLTDYLCNINVIWPKKQEETLLKQVKKPPALAS